jgi:hypothetical protein
MMDIEDPTLPTPNTDSVEPTFPNCRSDKELPKTAKSNNDIDEHKRHTPSTANAEPTRAKYRSDTELPTETKS